MKEVSEILFLSDPNQLLLVDLALGFHFFILSIYHNKNYVHFFLKG